MTREEAISFLIEDKKQRGNCFISEAVDIAIKALEQQPCNDEDIATKNIAKAFQLGVAFGFGKRYDEMDKVIDEIKKAITPEQEPCDELDFVQPHKKMLVNLEVCKMRDATPEEREIINKHIKSISKPTGVNIWDLYKDPCEDAISRQAVNELQKYRYNCGDITITCVSLNSINKLPSVTPQPKTGKWILAQRDKCIDISCSECGNC